MTSISLSNTMIISTQTDKLIEDTMKYTKNNLDMRIKIFYYIVICIFIPFVLVSIMDLNDSIRIFSFQTGSNGDWIGFWGSYLGAFVSGIVVMFVLVATINSNNHINNNKRLDDYNSQILRYISTRLSYLNPARIIRLIYDEGVLSTDKVSQLEEYNRRIEDEANTFDFLYEDDYGEFAKSYMSVVNVFVSKIHEFIILYKRMDREVNNSTNKQETLSIIHDKLSELSELQQQYVALREKGKKLIKDLKPKIQ